MVKLKDIAEKTGVTVASVSKALNGSTEISESTAQLVKTAAYEMGYRHKRTSKNSKSIGVILPEVRSHYYAELMHSLSYEIGKYGYSTITMLSGFSTEGVLDAYENMLQHDNKGLFISGGTFLTETLCQRIIAEGIPTVLFTEYNLPYAIDSIYVKTDSVMRLAVEHLTQLGHKKIGYLGEFNSDVRYDALCEVLEQNGVDIIPEFIKKGKERFELGGYLRACELLQEKELPTAVITSYDQMAFGAMRAFFEKGIKVPDEISIVGVDNTVMDEYLPVQITSVHSPVNQMGVVAVKLLMDNIAGPSAHVVQNVALQSKLIVRNSTGSPNRQ
jgi:DNA-binding LacI/PurR family transcriptional regulator